MLIKSKIEEETAESFIAKTPQLCATLVVVFVCVLVQIL